MAVAGDILGAATIRAARAGLATLGEDLARAADDVDFDLVGGARELPLVPLPASVVDAALAESSTLSVWANDLLCRQRATVGAALLQRGATGQLAAPAEDAIAAGVVIGTSRGINLWGWDFHAATAYRQVGERGIRVHDPLLFDRPVSLTRWSQAIGTTPSDVMIETPLLAHRPFLDGGDMAPTALLDETWDRIPAGYVMPGELRLDPSGTDTVMQRFRARGAAA